MEVKLEVSGTHSFNVSFTPYMLEELVRVYNGDIERYFSIKYKEFFSLDQLELNLEDTKFSYEEARKALKEKRENLPLYGDFRKYLDESQLRELKIDTPSEEDEKGLTEVSVNVDLLEKALLFTGYNAPKKEMNYIHLNGSYIEAADERKMVRFLNHEYEFKSVLLPTAFVAPLRDGAKLFIYEATNTFFLKYKNEFFTEFFFRGFRYPNFDNVLPKSFDELTNIMPLEEIKTRKCTIDNFKEATAFQFKNKENYGDTLLFKEIVSLNVNMIGTSFPKEGFKPLYFWNEEVQCALMPINIAESEIRFHEKE